MQAAASTYKAALASDWSYVPALIGLAEIDLASVPVEARALAGQAVSIAPSDGEAHAVLGRALSSLGLDRAGRRQERIAARLEDKVVS